MSASGASGGRGYLRTAILRIAPVSDRTKSILGIAFWLIAMAAQFGDYHSSALAVIVFLCGTCLLTWAGAHHAQEKYRAGERILEPSYLIIFGLLGASICLLVAAGGYVWSRLADGGAKSNVASVPAGQPRIVKPQQPVKVYSQAEKDDLLNSTRQIANVLDKLGYDVALDIESTLHAWDELYNSKDLSKVPNLLAAIGRLRNTAERLREALSLKDGTALDQYRSYSQEIEGILRLPKEWQNNPIESLIVVSNKLERNVLLIQGATKTGDKNVLEGLLNIVGVSDFQLAQKNFLDWISGSKERIESLRTSLR
jgi:hypothetical protein